MSHVEFLVGYLPQKRSLAGSREAHDEDESRALEAVGKFESEQKSGIDLAN